MPAFNDRRQVDIDNVTIPQRHFIGDAVTNDFIHACTNRVGIRFVTQACGYVTVVHCVVVDQFVEFQRRDTGFHKWAHIIHHLCIEATGRAKSLAFFFGKIQWAFWFWFATQHVHDIQQKSPEPAH